MDAITRVSYYFPTHTLTAFQILGNLVINDSSYCRTQERSLLIAMLVLFAVACFFGSFTDTYTSLDGQKFWVIMMPFYGPLCFSLPTDEDKDRVYECYYLKVRDYVHAMLSTSAFVLIMLFTNPICMCIFPSGQKDGTSQFDAAIVRTVPVVVAILTSMIMVCLGPPRQMLGFQNVPETCPIGERPMASNPVYAGSQGDYPPTIPEGDEDYESGPGAPGSDAPPPIMKSQSQNGPMGMGGLPKSTTLSRNGGSGPRESYHNEYRSSMNQARQNQNQGQRTLGPSPTMVPSPKGDYGASDGGYSSFRQE